MAPPGLNSYSQVRSVDGCEDSAGLLMLHGEIAELVEVGADDLVGYSEGQVAQSEQARRDAGSRRAHETFVAVAIDSKEQGLTFRGHVEATVRQYPPEYSGTRRRIQR